MVPRFTPSWQATIKDWTFLDWRAYASKRLHSLLYKHPVLSTREMESRLSDFGTNLLPPVHPQYIPITSLQHENRSIFKSLVPIPFPSIHFQTFPPLLSAIILLAKNSLTMLSLITSLKNNFVDTLPKKLSLIACATH